MCTPASIKAMTRAQIWRYYRRHYAAPNVIISVAGNIKHAVVVRLVKKAFDGLPGEGAPRPPRVAAKARPAHAAEGHSPKSFEQVNLVLGMKGLTRSDPRRHVLGVEWRHGGGKGLRIRHRFVAWGICRPHHPSITRTSPTTSPRCTDSNRRCTSWGSGSSPATSSTRCTRPSGGS